MLNQVLFALLAFFWGGSFIAIKNLIIEVPSFSAAFYRVGFSVVFLAIIYLKSIKIPKGFSKQELLLTSITGLCSVGIPFSLLFWGERFITPSIAGVINGTVPFWTLIVGILFFNELKNLTYKKLIGLALGFIGIIFIFGPKLTLKGDSNELWGLLAVVGMAFSYAIGINLNKRILSANKYFTKSLNIIVQQIASAIYLLLVVLVTDGVPNLELLLRPVNGLSVIYLSLFSTCLAFIIFYRLIEQLGAIKASTVTFFVPAVALLLDYLIYNAQLSILEGIGAIIILLSMVLLKEGKTNQPEVNVKISPAKV